MKSRMLIVEERYYEEIERDTGLSQGNIRIIVMRARQKLKQQFQKTHPNMDKLNDEELERIPIPEGLEERLSAKIDEWEKNEKKTLRPSPHYGGDVRRTERVFSLPIMGEGWGEGLRVFYWLAATSIALVFGVSYYFLQHEDEPVNLAEQDTYQDPLLAQQEAEKALNLLALNLNKGIGHLEKAKAISDRTETTLNKQLNILK